MGTYNLCFYNQGLRRRGRGGKMEGGERMKITLRVERRRKKKSETRGKWIKFI